MQIYLFYMKTTIINNVNVFLIFVLFKTKISLTTFKKS